MVEAHDPHNPSNDEVARIIAAFDQLIDAVEAHGEALQAELPVAEASGDPRHRRRLDRGGATVEKLLDVLDGPVIDYISELRHVAAQLGVARQGKIV